MKLFNMITVASINVVAFVATGCAVGEPYYGYQNRQQEHGAVAAINQHGQAVHAVNANGLIPPGYNCDQLDYGVTYAGTNSRYDVQSYGGQTCKGGPKSRAGVDRPPGRAGASFEDCQIINFSTPECQIYLQGGGR